MNVSRFVSFATAVVLSAMQWTVFLIPTAKIESVPAVSIAAVDHATPGSACVPVIRPHRQA